MNIYLIIQSENSGYDAYDSAVVAADSEDAARNTMPGEYEYFGSGAWCSAADKVTVKYLGVAAEEIEAGAILASFNAG